MINFVGILSLTNFTSLVIFNYLPPCSSFWLSFLLLKCMPVIIFSNISEYKCSSKLLPQKIHFKTLVLFKFQNIGSH